MAPKAIINNEPPTAPSVTIDEGIDKTPVAKMSLRKMKQALTHETVRKLTPPSTVLNTST